jgi:hypothetical protein
LIDVRKEKCVGMGLGPILAPQPQMVSPNEALPARANIQIPIIVSQFHGLIHPTVTISQVGRLRCSRWAPKHSFPLGRYQRECDTCDHMLFDNSQSDSVRKVHKATICENPLRALPRNDNLYLIGFQSGKEGNGAIGGMAAIRVCRTRGRKKGEMLTLRGSPSPPESWSRREPPPGLGSTKSTPSMKAASGAGRLCTRGSSAAWKPNSDAKGIYIKCKDRGRGRRSRGVMRAKGARTNQVALYIPQVQFMQARVGSWVVFVWPGGGLKA